MNLDQSSVIGRKSFIKNHSGKFSERRAAEVRNKQVPRRFSSVSA
jgi:hypothetical protein